jgi:PAS domain S-box-containing protein
LHQRWRPLVPLALAIISLVSLVLVLLVVEHRTRDTLDVLANVVDPARAAVTDIELALALEMSASRGFLATGDERFATNHLAARAARQRAEARLIPLTRQIGPSVMQGAATFANRLDSADATSDSLYNGRMPKADFLARIDEQRSQFASVVADAGRIDTAILRAAASRRRAFATTQRLGTALSSLLVFFACIALILLERLGARFQALALRLDAHEWQQAALREAASRLNASVSVSDAAKIVADGAVSATSALGAIVELARDDGHAAVALGTASPGYSPRSTTIGYQGSLTQKVANSGSTIVPAAADSLLARMGPRTPTTSDGLQGEVIPLVLEQRVRGALAVVRPRMTPQVEQVETSYLEALTELASSLLRRADLVSALRDSEERFRQVAENIRGFIWLRDPASPKFLYANAAYESIWGRTRESLYQNPFSLLEGVHPDDRARVSGLLTESHPTEYDLEYRVVRPDGELRWVWSRGFPVRDDRGEIYRMAGVTEDITEWKRSEFAREKLVERERAAREASEAAQAAAERRREELERISGSRTRLVRGFTHDVKNPLGAADGFLALLEEGVFGKLEERQQESVARARGSIRRALELIGGALELARTESGDLALRSVELDLGAVINEAVVEYRAQAEAKDLELQLDASRDAPAIVSDPGRIRQIVGNLLSNAIKYTPARGHIDVRVERASADVPAPGDWAVVSVSDTGRGIPPEVITKVFDEFTRLDPEDGGGAGVGLAISQRLASALKGKLTVESREGAGSRFSLWLPLPAAPALPSEQQ